MDRKEFRVGCVGFVVILITIWIFTGGLGIGKKPKVKLEHDPITAYVMSQKFVKNLLKSPATAKFPNYSEDKVDHIGQGEYLVFSYVDAQNSFGAVIRSSYSCDLKYVGEKKWELISCKILD